MATLGDKFKKRIDRVLNNAHIRSTATLTPVTVSEGSYGGYGANTETEGTATTIYCIPVDYLGTRFIQDTFGNIDSGNVRLIIKAEETVNKEHVVTYNSDDYKIVTIKPFYLAGTKVAQILELSKDTS